MLSTEKGCFQPTFFILTIVFNRVWIIHYLVLHKGCILGGSRTIESVDKNVSNRVYNVDKLIAKYWG